MPEKRRLLRTMARFGRPLLVAVVSVGLIAPAVAAYAEPSLTEIEQQIEKDAEALEKVVESYNEINEQLKATKAAINRHNAKLAPLKTQLDAASARVGEMAAIAYKGGAMMEYNAVLNGASAEDMVDRITSLDQLARHQRSEVTRVTETKTQFEGEAARLAKLQAQQTQQLAQLTAKKGQIERDMGRLEELRRKARARIAAQQAASQSRVTTSSGGTSTVRATAPAVSGSAGKAVRYAYSALGRPYKWGAEGPGGYDCSGLTLASWRAAGVSLPHNARMQYNALPHIKRSSLRPGDLVFYRSLGHVGIYVGNNQMIHAPTFGEVVKLAPVDVMPPYGYARPS